MKNINKKIQITIKTQCVGDKKPNVVLYEDFKIINETATERTIEWDWPNSKPIKKVSIGFNNKHSSDTRVENNQIVEDLSVQVDSIVVGGIDLSGYKDKFGIYKTEEGKILRTHGYMGFNGTYTFKFRYNPMYKIGRAHV